MNHNKSKKPKKVYRLAVYGLSASGKTCVLAALSRPRYPHVLEYSRQSSEVGNWFIVAHYPQTLN